MKSIFAKYAIIAMMLMLLAGCTAIEDSISEEEAKQLVIEFHTGSNGSPTILSIELKRNAYYVEWENIDNREFGIDKVTKDGEVKIIEAAIE